jgi:hypothetical protein
VSDPRFDATMKLAEAVAFVLEQEQVPCVVIGALALAAYHYPRATEDLDLAVAVAPSRIAALAARLRTEGWEVEARLPDADDPLGGVIDVRAPGADLVQVVNFDNSPAGGFPRLVHEAVAGARSLKGSTLRLADLPALVAFKLYAGGPGSTSDILELLARNVIDLAGLRGRCRSLHLDRELERVLALRSDDEAND